MTTTDVTRPPATQRVPAAVRGAQALLLLPLGALQFVAAAAFLIADGVHGAGDCAVAAWVLLMAPCSVAIAIRLGRRRATLRTALLLLAAESAFSAVKLTVYHESASLVFFGFIAACAGLLVLPTSRRHLIG